MFDFYKESRHLAKCFITVPYAGTRRVIKTKWVSQAVTTFSVKIKGVVHSYNLILTESFIGMKNNPILYYDLNTADPLKINMSSKGKSSEIYAISLKNRDVKEMLEEGSQGKLLIIIGLFVIAIIGVALYGQWQISQDNDKILTLTNTIIQMYHNATKITLVKP